MMKMNGFLKEVLENWYAGRRRAERAYSLKQAGWKSMPKHGQLELKTKDQALTKMAFENVNSWYRENFVHMEKEKQSIFLN